MDCHTAFTSGTIKRRPANFVKLFMSLILLLTLASCSSMKQIWDLKGIKVSANDQIFTGKSTTVPMDIKSGNLRYVFNATSDPVDNGYPITIKIADSTIASVTQSASNPSQYTITGLKSGYTTVTASCSSAYTFDFIVYVADSARGVTLEKLKASREDEIARAKAEEDARIEAENLAKQQAAEKAAADKAAADAAAKKAAEEAASRVFSPKAGDVYAVDEANKKYIYFPSTDEMCMTSVSSYDSALITRYKVKYNANNAKTANGICFKNAGGTLVAYLDNEGLFDHKNYDVTEESHRYEIVTDKGSKTASLYDKWKLRANDCVSDMFFSGYFTLLFTNNGRVTWTGSSYHFAGNYGDMKTVSKTFSYTNKDGLIKIEGVGKFYDGSGSGNEGIGDFYYDGKALRYVKILKKISDSATIQKVKNARMYTSRDDK